MTNEITTTSRLDEALATLIEKSVSGIDKASEFLVGEIPDVVYQLLLWHGVSSLIQFLVGVILLPLTILMTYKISKKLLLARKQKETWSCWDEGSDLTSYQFDLSAVGCIVGCVSGTIISVVSINIEWLQIWIAPKVWLLEYAAQLVK